jgi:hypothetical protein
MHPYRTPPPESPKHEVDADEPRHDDRVLGLALLLIGGVRVATAFAQHEVFASESTIALFMVAMALGLILRRR